MVNRMDVREAVSQQGCWIDGSRGWRAAARLVEIAQAWGMRLDEDDRSILGAYLASEDQLILSTGEDVDVAECVIGSNGLADKAEGWLNEDVVPEGWEFGWDDGAFFLWTSEQWARIKE